MIVRIANKTGKEFKQLPIHLDFTSTRVDQICEKHAQLPNTEHIVEVTVDVLLVSVHVP